MNHSELLGYRVRYHRNITCDSAGNYTNCSFSIFLCKNFTTIWLEDLEIYTDYWIEVVAFKNGTFSENISTSVDRTDEGGKLDGFAPLSSTIWVKAKPKLQLRPHQYVSRCFFEDG